MTNQSACFTGLKCRECGKKYPAEVLYVCEYCFGPLEIDYDYERIASQLTRSVIQSRPLSMWRYRELLPVRRDPVAGFHTGFTPLVRAHQLEKRLGVREIWIKNDAVNYPTLSFKDRVVSVALTSAKEFGFDTVGCASTGNLANALAAQSAYAGLKSFILIPADLEEEKIIGSQIYGSTIIGVNGTYDQVNRLCGEIVGQYQWGFVNINLRPYYAEGSKTMGYEIAEQLGWRLPDHIIVPMAGGSLIAKIEKAFKELLCLQFVSEHPVKIHGAQAGGCSPIVNALKECTQFITPVRKPDTIVKSLAIGDPADGYYALQTIRKSGGYGENPTDEEVIDGIKFLAECEGIFAETAGGVVMGSALRLIDKGIITSKDSLVLCITGNGLKTKEAVTSRFKAPETISPSLKDFEKLLDRSSHLYTVGV